MPCFSRQLSSQTIGQWFESRRPHRFDIFGRELSIGFSLFVTVRAGAESARGNDAICWMTGREVDGDGDTGLRQQGDRLETKCEANKEYERSYNRAGIQRVRSLNV